MKFINLPKTEPYSLFVELQKNAKIKQANTEACCISSLDKYNDEVDSRYVNIKYIDRENWHFFSNYESPKAAQFESHNQIACNFYWSSINCQIRIKARIYKSDPAYSDQHYIKRSKEKNALAHSSKQSKEIESFEEVILNYKKFLELDDLTKKRPKNWGGYCFNPYYFEFWTGNKFRLNKRVVFEFYKQKWIKKYVQP